MIGLLGENAWTPVIWDWCIRCNLYLSHTNGYARGSHMAMVCRQCGLVTIVK